MDFLCIIIHAPYRMKYSVRLIAAFFALVFPFPPLLTELSYAATTKFAMTSISSYC